MPKRYPNPIPATYAEIPTLEGAALNAAVVLARGGKWQGQTLYTADGLAVADMNDQKGSLQWIDYKPACAYHYASDWNAAETLLVELGNAGHRITINRNPKNGKWRIEIDESAFSARASAEHALMPTAAARTYLLITRKPATS